MIKIKPKKNIIKIIIAIIVLTVGVSIIAYPFVSTYFSDKSASYVVVDYDQQMKNMQKQELENRKEKARAINKELSTIITTADEMFKDAQKSKDAKQNEYKIGELEGYVVIPKINVSLPIYEGTTNDVLEEGVGHLTTSSLPTGGKGTHCVLTGHSGLSTATMFSDLDKLQLGDVFYIKFLDEIHKYKVDDINIIEPQFADDYIQSEKKKDLCTLITCTPKTINSHRLLVRGHRVKYTNEDMESVSAKIKQSTDNTLVYIIIASIVFVILMILIIILWRKRKRRQNKQ